MFHVPFLDVRHRGLLTRFQSPSRLQAVHD
jgi:hypothetical protein